MRNKTICGGVIMTAAVTIVALMSTLANAAEVSYQAKNLRHKISFDEIYNRYPSPYAIIQQFHRIVPVSDETSHCFQMDENSAPVSGVIDPIQNGALEQSPGALFFIRFIRNVCASLSLAGLSLMGKSQVIQSSSWVSN